jgi:adenosylcobinamide-GDP ribazoletransferase
MSDAASDPVPASAAARHVLLAVSFLTRVPVRRLNALPSDFAKAPLYFPFVGTGIGAVGAGCFYLAHWLFPVDVSVVVTLGLLMLLTGALHEDGLADSADAFGSKLTKADILEVMRDSRIGTYGTLALVMAVLLKFVVLRHLSVGVIMASLVAVHTLSRWAVLPGLMLLPYPRNSAPLSKRIVEQVAGLRPGYLVLSTAYTVLLAVGIFRLKGAALLLTAVLVSAAGMWYFKRKLSGATGDCYGALQQCTELALYLTILALS